MGMPHCTAWCQVRAPPMPSTRTVVVRKTMGHFFQDATKAHAYPLNPPCGPGSPPMCPALSCVWLGPETATCCPSCVRS